MTIYVPKNWDVEVVDLQGLYLGADNDELMHMVLRGYLSKIVVLTAP